MSDKAKGIMQFIAVVCFIAGSLMISALLQATKAPLKERGSNSRALYVETKVITPAPYRITFHTTGTVEARATISVVPEVTGRITKINESFFEGGTFEKDEILFEINPRDFELEVERLEAEVARAQTTLDLTKAESEAALSEWKILNNDKSVPDLVARKPQLAEAAANLKAAKAQLENAKLDLERTKFSLPFSGRVLEGTLELGQYVSTGQSYGTVFDVSGLEVKSSLEDQKLEWLMATDNTDVIIKTDYLGQKQNHKGVLKRAAASLNNATRFATVTFGFAENNVDLLPGIFANIEINGPLHKDIMRIPASALQKEGVIWIVKDDNTMISTEPDILFSDNDHIAVRNMDGAHKIVTSRVSGASDGMGVMTDDQEEESKAESNTQEQK
jgi:RND family efflux transporter MFP subunit